MRARACMCLRCRFSTTSRVSVCTCSFGCINSYFIFTATASEKCLDLCFFRFSLCAARALSLYRWELILKILANAHTVAGGGPCCWLAVCAFIYSHVRSHGHHKGGKRERNSYRRPSERAALTCPMFNIARAALFNLLSQFNRNFLLWQGKHAKETTHSVVFPAVINYYSESANPARPIALAGQIVQNCFCQWLFILCEVIKGCSQPPFLIYFGSECSLILVFLWALSRIQHEFLITIFRVLYGPFFWY